MQPSTKLPFDQIVVLDLETAWDSKTYTLSKMTTEEYVRDPRFKAWGLCWKIVGARGHAVWVRGKDIAKWAATFDWSRTAVLAHNAQFDVTILCWHYGIQPAFIFDTLSMARALRGIEAGNSLAKLAEDFGLPPKGRAVHSTDGMLDEIPFLVEQELAQYCQHDTFLCEEIFKRLLPGYPSKELRLIDMTLRMYVRPLLVLDADMLTDALHEERETREVLLARLNVTDAMLASNPQFAELLRSLGCEPPMKKSKTTGEMTYALAKNDAMFQALLHGDREEVSLLCEARLKVKSTLERTRAQSFLDISQRGPLPVPLSYYGAITGRWTASKGSAINMQNLKRGSFLRKAIMAPEGYVLVVGDLSQIEPRVLAWLADYDDLLDTFRSGVDAYGAFGAQMFNTPGLNKMDHPDLRQSAKSAMLGCFGSQTPVLTDRGWVSISEVERGDRLWDGVEWVSHQGLVPQGEKEVLTAHGVSATSDHEILTAHGWVEWRAVLASPFLFQSAIALANSPVSAGSSTTTAITQQCAALAGGRGAFTAATSNTAARRGATGALNEKLSRHAGRKKAISQCAPTVLTETGYSIASALSSYVARILQAPPILTTAGAALRFIRNGWRTVSSSFVISSGYRVGTTPSYNSTASTTSAATFPATFGSQRVVPTWQTSGASPRVKWSNFDNVSLPLKQRTQTYDIAYAGPRNRYTIRTDAGPIIVHNCGYQLGWSAFAAQLLVGFLGAPPVRYDKAFAKKLGVDGRYIERFLDWEPNVERMKAIPHNCSDDELLVHALASKKIIDLYRETAHPITAFWELCQALIERSLYGGEEYQHKCLLFRKGEIVLPNGMAIRYPDLRKQVNAKTGKVEWVYGPDATKLYAGKITNNVTQALARIVMTDGMLRVAKRYPVAGTVHDEQIDVVPEAEAEEALKWVLAQMTIEPSYMPGIPLAADGGFHRRYGLAKQ